MRAGKAPRIPLAAALTTGALLASLTGCVTVHGEDAVIPAVSKGEAVKILETFTVKNNRANTAYDTKLNASIETGALGAIDQAGLKSRKEVHPKGNPDYRPLKLTDTRYLIPKQAGWPKFFVTDSRSNRQGPGRWLFVFQRDRAQGPWKASYLAVVAPRALPRFARDKDGNVEAVPTGSASGLTLAPDKLSRTYTRYLQDGAGDDFTSGVHTTRLRERRVELGKRTDVRNEFAEQTAEAPQFAPFGLRTADGGALAFFTSRHHHKQTLPRGYHPKIKEPLVKALMSGTPKQSVTFMRISEQAVKVPPKKSNGKIAFLSRIEGLTAARGS
ncbi:hypothetical protein [Streptomyces axinellae]|uniref:DUF8094 domain-containing protein n=1 Tax=Streptomyces axinellae TaxID=552788 RepID=A0ABP6C1D5_9ACTN